MILLFSVEARPQPKYNVIWLDEENQVQAEKGQDDKNPSDCLYTVNNPFPAKIRACDRVTPEHHFQDVR